MIHPSVQVLRQEWLLQRAFCVPLVRGVSAPSAPSSRCPRRPYSLPVQRINYGGLDSAKGLGVSAAEGAASPRRHLAVHELQQRRGSPPQSSLPRCSTSGPSPSSAPCRSRCCCCLRLCRRCRQGTGVSCRGRERRWATRSYCWAVFRGLSGLPSTRMARSESCRPTAAAARAQHVRTWSGTTFLRMPMVWIGR